MKSFDLMVANRDRRIWDLAQGKPVTISVKKESQAVKIQRLLDEHVDAVVAESDEQKAKDGQSVLHFRYRAEIGQEGSE